MNEIQVTVRGNVASDPKNLRFDDGNTLTSFRLASNQRHLDRERNEWVDRGTTYFTVNCRKALASNVAKSIRKGQPVMVTGRLRERFWTSNDRSGQTLVVEAQTLGHDLLYGATEFVRIARVQRIRVVGADEGDQVPTDLSGFAVLDEDVAGAHDAELLGSGDPADRRAPSAAAPANGADEDLDDDLDDNPDQADDFDSRVPDHALA